MSCPLYRIFPADGLRNLVRRLKHVVLPAPFGPINAWILPRRTLSATSRTAKKPANSLVKPSVSRMNSSAKQISPRQREPRLAVLVSFGFRRPWSLPGTPPPRAEYAGGDGG